MSARWLLAATAAHGLIIALLWLAPVNRFPPNLRGPAPMAEIGIEAGVEPAQVHASRAREASPVALERRDREHARPTTKPRGSASGGLPSTAGAPPEPEAQVPPGVAQPPTLSAEALGLAGRNIFLGQLPSMPAQRREPEQAPNNLAPGIDRSVREAIAEDDVRRGLSAGGGVVSLAEQVVRASSTPVNSDARLDITVDASGAVSAIVVAAASEGFSEWERVAADLKKALAGRTIRIPRGASGLAIALEATSCEQRPSGHDADTEVTLFGIPVKKAAPHSKQPNRVDVLKPDARTVDVVQPPELSPPVKLPQKQRVSSVSVGLAFDPVDIGSHAQRVVHVRVLREKAL